MSNQEPEETPEETPAEETTPEPEPEKTPTAPSAPAPSPPSSDARENSRLVAELMKAQQLSVQNFQLIVSRVDQMADSLADSLKMMQEALQVIKATADIQQEMLASLNEQTERLITVAAALIQYSQEQAAIASGGAQGN